MSSDNKEQSLLKNIIESRKLIFTLAWNDFKTKYAGSYLGIIWAFVQPVIMVVMYWFVMEHGLSAGSVLAKQGIHVKFVCYLVSGLVPWFFFSDAVNGGTAALLQYNYLVKKVVFNIDILPVVKVLSAFYVHVFFVLFCIIFYAANGIMPSIYTIQLIYYSFCLFILTLALSYITSAIVVFFRDLTQVVNIALMVGIWATPIMWPFSMLHNEILIFIFKLNPVFYIVQGFRDSLYDRVWFWQETETSVIFWVFVIIAFWLGTTIFKKLRVHFADVL
ncbi:teichoic acid transport system permease protein [Acetitomaculum ruminis DSM 5522]|uniref:Transport permease protein n=1 Tax=Acetitomaculum ruminis DSM 5522 TaxID=1120918 RepID=A0A1I0VMC5_9FIRM|nr:ABC transporter permease [Acetitomaculum ruminis]SFA77574.1 teichoic acid transport system permease protein [Acetitomaculum ruminis DSM 5522]